MALRASLEMLTPSGSCEKSGGEQSYGPRTCLPPLPVRPPLAQPSVQLLTASLMILVMTALGRLRSSGLSAIAATGAGTPSQASSLGSYGVQTSRVATV